MLAHDQKLDIFLNKILNMIIAYEDNCCKDISNNELSIKEVRYIESANLLLKSGRNTSVKIANYLFITPSTLSVMTKRLEAKGYIKRVKSTSDQRVTYIIPTKKGEEIITYHQAYHAKLFHMIDEKATPEEQKGLVHVLKIVEQYFTGETPMRPIVEETDTKKE